MNCRHPTSYLARAIANCSYRLWRGNAWDMGYAAWVWLDLGHSAIEAAEQRRRWDVFASFYAEQLSHDRLIESISLASARFYQ